MSYIKYLESEGWDYRLLNSEYDAYFKSKLKLLQTEANVEALEAMAKAKIWSQKINGEEVVIDESVIAKAATSKIGEYTKDISNLYEQTLGAINSSQEVESEIYQSAASRILQGIQGGLAEGETFTIDLNSSTALDLEKAATQIPIHVRGNLSNTLGDVGEGVSALAGRALVDSLIEEFEKQLGEGTVNKSTIKAKYTNKGAQRVKSYRSQTDNELRINFELNPEKTNGGNVARLEFVYNISDKANKALAKLTEKTKNTDSLKIRNSTVGHLLKDNGNFGKGAIYNTISYHRKNPDSPRYSGMQSKAGKALRAYAGYKLLLETFLESKKHKDEINFTVYGNKIIPENSVVQTMLEKTAVQYLTKGGIRGGNYSFFAEIRYYQLVSTKNGNQVSNVNSIEEAEKLIRSMPVEIKGTFQFE